MSDWVGWSLAIAPVSLFYILLSWLYLATKTSKEASFKSTSSYKGGIKRIKVAALVFTITACIVFSNVSFDKSKNGDATASKSAASQSQALSESTAQVMAKTICEMRVKDTLKAPSTADFPFFSQATFDGSRRATLSSYVDAQNGFGAMLRTNFVCTVEYGGGDTGAFESWKIVDFVVLQ